MRVVTNQERVQQLRIVGANSGADARSLCQCRTPRPHLRRLGEDGKIDQQIIPGANHFFDGKLEPLMESVTGYLDMRLANVR